MFICVFSWGKVACSDSYNLFFFLNPNPGLDPDKFFRQTSNEFTDEIKISTQKLFWLDTDKFNNLMKGFQAPGYPSYSLSEKRSIQPFIRSSFLSFILAFLGGLFVYLDPDQYRISGSWLDPDSIRQVDGDPDLESGSGAGSRRAKDPTKI
jgi:hypothetical protein